MNCNVSFSGNKTLKWVIVFFIVSACIDRVDFDAPPAKSLFVIEGSVNDRPGPYSIKVSRGLNLDAVSVNPTLVENMKIKLFDDEGNSEDYIETEPGNYQTQGIIRGEIGHSYYVRLETADGKIFESKPDKMNPAGEIEKITYEYQARTTRTNFGEPDANIFNIYVDANTGSEAESFVRWRFNGTYKILANPQWRMTYIPGFRKFKDPPRCSGYIVTEGPIGSGGLLTQVDDCSCCTCWVSQNESIPQLANTQLVIGNKFNNIKVAEVPIDKFTFYEKYLVEIDQLSLSKTAFEFFQQVRKQKTEASSLFQPPSAEIQGNIKALNSSESIIGIFWAASITSKHIFINRSEVPYLVLPIDSLNNDCRSFFKNSTISKPDLWE